MPKKTKRQAVSDEPAQSDSFIVLFTALMMILLAFFILLNSLSTIDERRKRLALGSILGSFGILPSGQGYDSKGEIAPDTHPIAPGVRREVYLQVLGRIFKGLTAPNEARILTRGRDVVLRFRSDILFPSGVSSVSPTAFNLLDQVAYGVRLLRCPIRIEGHSDTSPGADGLSNWRLSTERAVSVLRYLRDVNRLPESSMTVTGFADTRPANGEARAIGDEHRRVEIVFINAEEAPLE